MRSYLHKCYETLRKDLDFHCFKKIRSAYAVFQAATIKFKQDNCSTRGNAIAYAVVVSIIPLSTIFIQLAKVNRSIIQKNIISFLASYGLSTSTELLVILEEIMARAETIAGVGFVFVLYSATNFFRHLEKAFNHIYCARQERFLLHRFALYIAAFVLFPIIAISTSKIIENIHYRFQSPELREIMVRKGKTWLVSSDGILKVYAKRNEIRRISLPEEIANHSPFRDFFIDLKSKRMGHSWEVLDVKNYSYQLADPSRYNLIGAVQSASTIYTVSSGAMLFYSRDEGLTWKHQQLIFRSDTDIYTPLIKDIHLSKEGKVLLLVDEVSHSAMLVRDNERSWRYHRLKGRYHRMAIIDNVASFTHTSVNGIYLLGRGNYLYSVDEARTWNGPFAAHYGDRKPSITAIQADANGDMYFGGANGAFWIQTQDGNKLYPKVQTLPEQSIAGIDIQRNGHAMLYGHAGLLRYSSDWGRTWHLMQSKMFSQIDLISHQRMRNGFLYLCGSDDSLFSLANVKLSKNDDKGEVQVIWEDRSLSSVPSWRAFLVTALLEPLLFVIVFFMLSLLYVMVPHAYVKYRAAALGAVISALGLMLFSLIFRFWLHSFSTAGFIYGVWAAVPVGMLIILIAVYILLFGLEVAYVVQHPLLYQGDRERGWRECLFWDSLLLLCLVYDRLYQRNQALKDEEIRYHYGGKDGPCLRRLETSREGLIQAKLIYYDSHGGQYFPLEAAKAISLQDLQQRIADNVFTIPDGFRDAKWNKDFSKLMQKPSLTYGTPRGRQTTVADILPEFMKALKMR